MLNAFSAYMNSIRLNFDYDSAIALFKYNLIKLLIITNIIGIYLK